MRLALGADHAGFALKEKVKKELQEAGYEVVDFGAHEYNKEDDYPDFAAPVGHAVASGEAERGIIICGSGVGACIAANKIEGVRACLCHDIYSASQGVAHDDMNVLCLGARIVGEAVVPMLIAGFLETSFIGEGRFLRRLNKVLALEKEAEA